MTPQQVRMLPDVRTALKKLNELPVNTPIEVDGRIMSVRVIHGERTLSVNACHSTHPQYQYEGTTERPHDGRTFGNVKLAHAIAKYMVQS